AESPIVPPGTRFIYSDINYETLGEIVRRISGQTLDAYCAQHIFKPLGMRETMFNPPARFRLRIAPTEYEHGTTGRMLWGEVHDPTARDMGGVAGDVGLLFTASELAGFAEMILEGGSCRGPHLPSPLTAAQRRTAETAVNHMD